MPQDILDIYTDYLISQNQHATAIGLANLLDGQCQSSPISRGRHALANGSQCKSAPRTASRSVGPLLAASFFPRRRLHLLADG
jgi:hypothetical protein